MHLLQPHLHSRRAFLRRTGQLALTGTALPFALNLATIGEAAAFDATDYKALVCVFMYGGNDYANTVVAYDNPNYNLYSAIRGGGAGQTAGGIAQLRGPFQDCGEPNGKQVPVGTFCDCRAMVVRGEQRARRSFRDFDKGLRAAEKRLVLRLHLDLGHFLLHIPRVLRWWHLCEQLSCWLLSQNHAEPENARAGFRNPCPAVRAAHQS